MRPICSLSGVSDSGFAHAMRQIAHCIKFKLQTHVKTQRLNQSLRLFFYSYLGIRIILKRESEENELFSPLEMKESRDCLQMTFSAHIPHTEDENRTPLKIRGKRGKTAPPWR